ncbi:MYND-type domain-containing protein [Mycena venus]|uniref:MYND-type domain-containing protein n=1 Tax=Mycena venus TaxID=2733690 RepID=A0A8H6X4T8_9AGAR|nr:MYND-type domain-containing protein [Mycena venus]
MYLPTSADILAALGLSCSHCHKMNSSSEERGLLRCSGCRRLAYCNNECQKADWRNHKAICQTLQLVEKDIEATSEMAAAFPEAAQNDLKTLDRISVAHADQMVALCEKLLQRSLTSREIDVISYEPKCLACARTDMILRTKAHMPEAESTGAVITPCERCKMSFGCCDEHWSVARALHQGPCDDLPGTVSQCDKNLEMCADVDYSAVLTAAQEKHFMWRIIQRQATWSPLTGCTWKEVIGSDVASAAAGTAFERHVPACTRRISSLASTAFTILYALEHLNTGVAWTEKSELTINMIIASPLDFFEAGYVYEAILHRAPKVKKLVFYFFLPKGVPGEISQAWASEICGDCASKTKGIFNHFVMTRTFESFVHNEAELFVQPDLFIATSSTIIAEHDPAQWRRTIALLVARRIPSVFTTFSRRLAESGQAVMRECGAELVPSLSGVRNPFGDMKMNPNFDKVHGFHAPNAWFVGGFR